MDYKMIIKIIAIILIGLLFVYSGINKIFDFNDTTLKFHQKINSTIFSNIIPYNLSQGLIIIAILILLISPTLMLIGVVKNDNLLLIIGSILLIVFTLLATIIYHPITDPTEIYNILKNLSIVGGLAMITQAN